MKTIPVIAVFSIHEEADPGELWGCPEEEFDRLRGMGAVVTLEEAQARGIGQVDDSLIASLKEGAGSGLRFG